MRLRRIVHASDFSRASRRALAEAIALARRERAMLLVVHAFMPPSPFVGGELTRTPTFVELEARGRRAAERGLRAAETKAKKAGVRVRSRLVDGPPAEAIVRFARREHADLIVMGTHGRRGLSRFFMGSVARRVLSLTPCPVLTVRGR